MTWEDVKLELDFELEREADVVEELVLGFVLEVVAVDVDGV